jgi:hypothetical protein
VYGEEKYFVLGGPEQPWKDKNLFYRHYEPNEPTKAGPLSFVLFESPFTSVSTVSRAHPSLVSGSLDPQPPSFFVSSKKSVSSVNILYTTINKPDRGRDVQVVSSALIIVFHIKRHTQLSCAFD